MKNAIYGATIALLFMALTAQNLNAQATIAYIDSESIISEMADYKKAMIDLEAYSKQLEKKLKMKEDSLRLYYTEVQEKQQLGELTPKQLSEADEKLQNMQKELQLESAKAQQTLGQKEAEILKPVNERFNAALKKVATTSKYAYIVDKKMFLYLEGGTDATEQVKSALLE